MLSAVFSKNGAEGWGGGDWWIENIRNILGNYDNVSDVLDFASVGDDSLIARVETSANETVNQL